MAFFQEAIVEIHTLYKSTPISNMNYLAYIKSGSTSIEYTRMDESTGISTSMKGKRVVGLRRINLGSLYESHWESYRRGFLNKMEVKPKELDELEKELLKCSIEVNNSYFWEYVYKLSVHHKYYQEGLMAWEYPDEALLTLCWDCHTELHETTQIDHYDQFGNLIGQLTPCARCFGAGYFQSTLMLKMVFVSGVMVEDLTRPFGNRLLCNKKASAFKLRLFSLVIRSGLEPNF